VKETKPDNRPEWAKLLPDMVIEGRATVRGKDGKVKHGDTDNDSGNSTKKRPRGRD